MSHQPRHDAGQAIALFALALTTIVLLAALAVDGGYAFVQRRTAQNAADLAAMAGTRILGVALTGRPAGSGTAANVEQAIESVLAANGVTLTGARYVDEHGVVVGEVVGADTIPSGAFGIVVEAEANWQPFLLGVIGITDWAAGATATAVTPGRSIGGGVLPVGIQAVVYDDLVQCPLTGLDRCVEMNLTAGTLTIPGGFGWLSFGLQGNGGRCDWTNSLGMEATGCENSQPFLDSQIGPPPQTHGCCDAVGDPTSEDKIAALTGNEWGDLSYYVEHQIPVWVPVWDIAGGSGSRAWYHVVGFGAIVFTGDDEHAKWLEGAAVAMPCAENGHRYCAAPGDSFVVDVTGAVRLVR